MKFRMWIVWLLVLLAQVVWAAETAKAPFPYVWSKAYHVLPETHNNESGYFSICAGLDGRIYVGTAEYGKNAYLVEYDPASERQRVAVDTNRVCGLTATGYAAQAKIHTRNFVAPSGKIYIGSKQGYRLDKNDASEYPGGYVMVYDPRNGKTENLGMPYPTEGVIDVVADENRGLLYVVTCEEQHWMRYDMKTKQYRELGPMLTPYATTLVDAKGRAHAITKDFKLATYDPKTNKVTQRAIMLGKKTWTRANNLAIPIWVIAEDNRTAYLILLNDPTLIRFDLFDNARTVRAKDLGKMTDGEKPDSRSGLAMGPDGRVYATVRVNNTTGFGKGYLHHLLRYDPKTHTHEDLGVLAVKNPDFFDWTAKKPWTHGYHTLPDGTLTPLHGHQGLIVAPDNTIYVTILYPFTLLRIDAFTKTKAAVTPAEQYCAAALHACDRMDANMAEVTRVAEVVAKRHQAGGLIGFPWNSQGLQQELMGRAGGMVCTGFERGWKKERTEAEKANDIGIIGWEREPGKGELAQLQALKQRGVYLIGFGPKAMPALAEHVKLCDAFFDTGLPDDRMVTLPDGTKAGRINHLINALYGWALTGEIVGVFTRQGKMPTMWKSYIYPDGVEWGNRYLNKLQFHDDYTVPAQAPGVLGHGYVSQIRAHLTRFRDDRLDEVQRAVALLLPTVTAGKKVPLLSMGHMPWTYLGKFEETQWAEHIYMESILPAHVEAVRKKVADGSLVLRMGYFGVNPVEKALFREKKIRAIYLSSEHENPEWQFDNPETVLHVDMGMAFGDACVALPGYPICILPPSGIMQGVAFEAINTEMLARLTAKTAR